MTESIPFWEDWRVWSVAAAFFGFTFGTLIKFGFDLWLDFIRRNKENTVFAIAFRAELRTLINERSLPPTVPCCEARAGINSTEEVLWGKQGIRPGPPAPGEVRSPNVWSALPWERPSTSSARPMRF